jgi:hypothetical protein
MITKEKFDDYVRVQKSGVTNMFDVKYVEFLTDLSRDEILDIMENYAIYEELYERRVKND